MITIKSILSIAPEGTRKKVKSGKQAFYYIAHQSKIPIMMVSFDYIKKTVILNKFYTSGDLNKDFIELEKIKYQILFQEINFNHQITVNILNIFIFIN